MKIPLSRTDAGATGRSPDPRCPDPVRATCRSPLRGFSWAVESRRIMETWWLVLIRRIHHQDTKPQRIPPNGPEFLVVRSKPGYSPWISVFSVTPWFALVFALLSASANGEDRNAFPLPEDRGTAGVLSA